VRAAISSFLLATTTTTTTTTSGLTTCSCLAERAKGKPQSMVLDENFERISQFSDAFKRIHGAC
jgi:hypothetical protein